MMKIIYFHCKKFGKYSKAQRRKQTIIFSCHLPRDSAIIGIYHSKHIFIQQSLKFFLKLINLLLTMLGLCCCAGFSLVVAHSLLIAVASLVAEGLQGAWAAEVGAAGLQRTDLVVVMHGLDCSTACGVFLDQDSNPCLLHWQLDP